MEPEKILDMLSVDDIPEEQRDIAEVVGMDAYKQLVKLCGGGRIYIMQLENVIREKRNYMIRTEYNGYNLKELCGRYRISETSIRTIIKQER